MTSRAHETLQDHCQIGLIAFTYNINLCILLLVLQALESPHAASTDPTTSREKLSPSNGGRSSLCLGQLPTNTNTSQ